MSKVRKWRPSARFGREPVYPDAAPAKRRVRKGVVVALAALGCTVIAVSALLWWLIFAPPQARQALNGQQSLGRLDPLEITEVSFAPFVTPGPQDGQAESDALDLSAGSVLLSTQEENLNLPGLCADGLLYAAGTGSALQPVLKTLYYYDLAAGEETEIAKTQLGEDGEIFETHINERWMVYIDTNQHGNNQIFYIDRQDETLTPVLVKQTAYALPKLRLYENYLVWIEQTEEGTDDIWLFDLLTGENLCVAMLTGSATYGVSAPSISGNEIIWAAHDPQQSEADRENGEKSAIYVCNLDRLSEEGYEFEHFSAGMYVHEPLTNGTVWVWIDKNKAPDSNLYLKYRNGQNIQLVTQGVTGYAITDGMVVYAKGMQIWAYFYETDTYARLTGENEMGMQPVVWNDTVVWYDVSGDAAVDRFRCLTLEG